MSLGNISHHTRRGWTRGVCVLPALAKIRQARPGHAGRCNSVQALSKLADELYRQADMEPVHDVEQAFTEFNARRVLAHLRSAVSAGCSNDEDLCLMPAGEEALSSSGNVVGLNQWISKPPSIKAIANGARLETFASGSSLTKDALGRVVEVRSQYGDGLRLQYGLFGKLEAFVHTDSRGRLHSRARVDRQGVVVRDAEGRVRAVGQSMTIDPRGCLCLHSADGQYFNLDLVAGIHSERRVLTATPAKSMVITALFANDGFRMATMFAGGHRSVAGSNKPRPQQAIRLRFYGRDGSMLEFAGDEDLRDLCPEKVLVPASCIVDKMSLRNRQAGTAWQAVREYLMKVS